MTEPAQLAESPQQIRAGSTLNQSKLAALTRHLHEDPAHLVRAIDVSGWATTPPFRFRPCRSWEEFEAEVAAQAAEFPHDTARDRVIRALALYAGVAPEGSAARHFTLAREFDPHTIHPTARLGLPGRAAKVRAIPQTWQQNPLLRTPLVVTDRERDGELDLWFDEADGMRRRVAVVSVLEPVQAAPLAYMSAADNITINPIQVCPLSCTFCIRVHTPVQRFGLANFNPQQTADYMLTKLAGVDWAAIRLVKVITGAFPAFSRMLAFCEGLGTALREGTKGAFDPTRDNQTLHLLTNLGRTRDEFAALKAAGVRSLEHTVEIVDDQRRITHMTTSAYAGNATGKGRQRFADCLAAASTAVEAYGDRYGVTLVVGLDDLDTTLRGLRQLAEVGVTHATTGILVPNAYAEVSLFQMSFSEVMVARRAAARSFSLPAIFPSDR